MSIRSRIGGFFGGKPDTEATEEIRKVELPKNQAERSDILKLYEHAQAIEVFRAVDAIIAKSLNEALSAARVTPADKLARNEKYKKAIDTFAGLKSNPIRAEVEAYAQRKSDGTKKLMSLLSEELQRYVMGKLKALEAGEPMQHLNVAILHEALKKWSDVVDVNNQPEFDSATVRDAGEKIKLRLTPKSPRVPPDSAQV